jgi:hypothetical protein
MDHLSENNDTQIENEKIFLMRKIDEVKHEIFQLENNIQFLRIREMRRKKIVLEVRKTLLFIKKV